jgi:AraC family transcriptional regulator
MNEDLLTVLQPPRIEEGRTLLIAGLSARYNMKTNSAIPAQWERFASHFGKVPGQIGGIGYGVVCNYDNAGTFEYISGVEVSDFTQAPKELACLRIGRQTYAVFAHGEHISSIRRVWYTIKHKWAPESGRRIAEAPEFERYGEEFNTITGVGGFEIWIPLRS